MNKKSLSHFVVTSALIAAAYVALTYISPLFGLVYGNALFRISEGLNILACFTPAAIPGLTIGCFLSNLGSPLGILDWFVGTVATLLSAIVIRIISKHFKKATPFLSVLPPTVFNALLVGLELFLLFPENSASFFIVALGVGFGEMVVCILIGIPMYYIFKRHSGKIF